MGGPGSGRRKALDSVAPSAPTVSVTTGAAKTKKRITVSQPSGTKLEVLTQTEKTTYEIKRDLYMKEFRFTSSSDLADLDRLLLQELLDFRWSTQLVSGEDYEGRALAPVIEEQLRRNKNDAAKIISQVKFDLGMNRAARDATMDSPSEYISTLLKRAKEFGVHRNNQVVEALRLIKDLETVVGTYDRSNETERRKIGFESDEDIVEYVRSEIIPRFNKVDEEWQKSTQKYWEGL